MNNKTRNVYKIENDSLYRIEGFLRQIATLYGAVSHLISKFKRILRKDSTLHIDKTFQ